MKFYNSLFLFLICLVSCNENLNPKVKSKINLTDERIIDFFPTNTGDLKGDVLVYDTSGYYNTTNFFLKRKGTENDFINLQSLKFIKEISPIDSCIIIINDFLKHNSRYSKFKGQKSFFCKECVDNVPIPNFSSLELRGAKNTKLPKSFVIKVLYLKNELTSNKIDPLISSMPEKYLHGEIGGVAIDKLDSTLIYFVEKW